MVKAHREKLKWKIKQSKTKINQCGGWAWKGMREILLLSHEAQSGPTCQTEPWNYQQVRPKGLLESESQGQCLNSTAENQQVRNWTRVLWRVSYKHNRSWTYTSEVLQSPGEQHSQCFGSGTAPRIMSRCIPGKNSPRVPCLWSPKRVGFSQSHFPAWLQFGSISSFVRSTTKMFHLRYSGKKNQVAGLLVKARICYPALGAASVPDKLRVLLIKVRAWGHFWDHGVALGGLEDSPPQGKLCPSPCSVLNCTESPSAAQFRVLLCSLFYLLFKLGAAIKFSNQFFIKNLEGNWKYLSFPNLQ